MPSGHDATSPADVSGSTADAAGDGRVADLAVQLDYLADMILEMREIAERAELTTLAGILDLAHSEARLRAGARKGR